MLTSTQRTVAKKIDEIADTYIRISGRSYHTRSWPSKQFLTRLVHDVSSWYDDRLTPDQVNQVIKLVHKRYVY